MDAVVSGELEYIWSSMQAELAIAVDDRSYRIWLEPLRPRALSDKRLLVEANPQACGWIRERFGRVLQATAARVLGPGAVIDLVGGQGELIGRPDAAIAGPRSPHSPFPPTGARRRSPPPPFAGEAFDQLPEFEPRPRAGALEDPKLTFAQFVIGDCNRLAHAAALTVAEMPAQAYNPLFICGPPGVGKTHLLSAVASLLLSNSPDVAVRWTTGEAFTNAFLRALGYGQTDAFKTHFRHVDVLLLDDIQFLERKTKTEEEFFHTFNALYDSGRQIVLTSDRPPDDLQALEDRLRERFQAGLVAYIEPPDLPTRLAILRKRATDDRIELADGSALEVIAERATGSVRALEGTLIRVVASSSLTGRPLTGDLAREVLVSSPQVTGQARRTCPPSISAIQIATCQHFGLSPEELVSTRRSARIVWPRQLAMYLTRELTDHSLPAIGRAFGGRDHTTVLHAWRRTSERVADDRAARELVLELREMLQPGSPSRQPGSHHPDESPRTPSTASSTV
jgi:chromosomal replication initiator protein